METPEYESVNEPGTVVAVPGKNGYWVVTKKSTRAAKLPHSVAATCRIARTTRLIRANGNM